MCACPGVLYGLLESSEPQLQQMPKQNLKKLFVRVVCYSRNVLDLSLMMEITKADITAKYFFSHNDNSAPPGTRNLNSCFQPTNTKQCSRKKSFVGMRNSPASKLKFQLLLSLYLYQKTGITEFEGVVLDLIITFFASVIYINVSTKIKIFQKVEYPMTPPWSLNTTLFFF